MSNRRELVVHVLLLLYCHQVHSPRVLEKCLFRTIVIFVDSTSGWTLFCIWSSAMLMNRYFKLFFILLATIKRRTSSSFLLLLPTMHMCMNFIVPRSRRKCSYTCTLYTYMYMYSTRLRKCLLQFKLFDYAPY